MLNTDSRRRSAVGRISREEGEARLRPLNRPPTIRIRDFRHARACPGHPRSSALQASKTWMAGSGPAMTARLAWLATRLASQSLIPRLQIAFAMIAALGTARRAVAGVLVLVAGARLLAAGALHQHAAALAVGDQRALARRLERLLATRRFVLVASFILLGPREIGARKLRDTLAELFAQPPRLDLLDLTL